MKNSTHNKKIESDFDKQVKAFEKKLTKRDGVVMNRTRVISSNIASVGYKNGTLEIAFVGGGVYQYLSVPEHIYQESMSAASKGRYFHAHIKDIYQTR